MAHAASLNPNANLIRTGILQRPANFSEHSRFGNFDCSVCSLHCCPLDWITFSLGCGLFQVIQRGVRPSVHLLAIRPQSTRLTVFADFANLRPLPRKSIAGMVKVLTGRDNAMSGSTAHEIGIVHYPGAQVACILGLTDLFGIASTIALDQQQSGETPFRVTHWKPIHSRVANLSCVYDSAPHGRPQPRTLIIPPTLVNLPNPDVAGNVVSWIRSRHASGATLVALCSGAFILAETGLVDGQSVATHQICADALARRFPKIVVDTNRRIIDHGDIITAGGFLSWVDVGLFLVDKILGPATRAETARLVLSDPAADEARYFTGFAPPQTHGDRAILKAQEWVHMRDGRSVSLAAMATAAGLERRTLHV